jgi:hypothetical protein
MPFFSAQEFCPFFHGKISNNRLNLIDKRGVLLYNEKKNFTESAGLGTE